MNKKYLKEEIYRLRQSERELLVDNIKLQLSVNSEFNQEKRFRTIQRTVSRLQEALKTKDEEICYLTRRLNEEMEK